MFLVNSRLPRFHDTEAQAIKLYAPAHHLPKLRSYFAEFLQYHYLKRLSIQCQPTCVGFRYGFCATYFLRQTRYDQESENLSVKQMAVDGWRNSSTQTFVFCYKLSKRPCYLFKDYLIITKPGVMTTVVFTLLFVTYISIGETTLCARQRLTADGFKA